MSAEKPVSLKRRKKLKLPTRNKRCVVHNVNVHSYGDILPFSDISWTKVLKSKVFRLNSEDPKTRLQDICEQVPEIYNETCHGYHKSCYATFTNLRLRQSKRKADDQPADDQAAGPSREKRVSLGSGILFSKDTCIICLKKWRYKKRLQEGVIKCVTETAKNSISEAAKLKSDSRVIGLTESSCLVAQEAYYHETCRRDYTRKKERKKSATCSDEVQIETEKAHAHAFNYITEYVENQIIQNSNVERMTMLKEKYLSFIQSKHPHVYNPHYKTCKLKEKLQKKFGNKIKFWQPNYRSELVYSSYVLTGCAVESAFENASSDERRLQEAALLLRRLIFDTFKDSPQMPWPPSSSYLLTQQDALPPMLIHFMTCLLSKQTSKINKSVRSERLVLSMSQDICYNITQGRWKMPKHLLLGMTVRHLSGSSQMINILNRFGHCASHSTLLELETAMCDSVVECSSNLPAAAKVNAKITHFCWDNFDLNEETPSGLGTTHSTHGIIIQETTKDDVEIQNPGVLIEKSKKRSSTYVPTHIEPCFTASKVEPSLNVVRSEFKNDFEREVMKQNFLWMFCRFKHHQARDDIFPSWKGWVSATTEDTSERVQSIVDYMAPINASVNDLATVQKVLQISKDATDEVGQEYTFVTFDLAVAKKAYDLVWQHPDTYKNVVIHLGVFHTMLSYLGALGKVMRESGFEEVVIEARLCATGSLEKVMIGKHYNRCLTVHTIMLEALERLLFTSFVQNTGSGEQVQ